MSASLGLCECGAPLESGGAVGVYCTRGFDCPVVKKILASRTHTTPKEQFREVPALLMETLTAELCDPDEYEAPTLIRIVEIHTDGEEDEDVYVDVSEARALRDWLISALPADED